MCELGECVQNVCVSKHSSDEEINIQLKCLSLTKSPVEEINIYYC